MLMHVFWVLQVLDALLESVDGVAQDLCSRLALAIIVLTGVAALGPLALIACTWAAIAPLHQEHKYEKRGHQDKVVRERSPSSVS